MWNDWDKYVDRENAKCYEMMIGSKIKIRLGVYLTEINSSPTEWEVLVNAFAPGTGENIIYTDKISSFTEAEEKAWEVAQNAVRIRQNL